MKVFRGLGELPGLRTPIVTVGSFDGVHRGHRALLETVAARAREKGSDALAITFSPHPRKVLKPEEKTWLLTTTDEKLYLMEQAGIGMAVVIPFDEKFSRISYREFIDDIIVGTLGAGTLVVGYDHRFGHGKKGEYGRIADGGLEVIRVPEIGGDGLKISSTQVRMSVAQGDMATAAEILGHPYIVAGHIAVCHGGRPAMAVTDPDKLLPPPGRYPVRVGPHIETALEVTTEGLLIDTAEGLQQGPGAVISFL